MIPDTAGYDRDFVGLGSVIYHDNIYHMWYSGGNWAHLRIGHATSPDGITWIRDTIPVLDYGPTGSWDEDAAFAPQVIVISDMLHMWYVGHRGVANNYDFQIGHATSPDGITWTKDPNNPVLPRGSSGAWDYAWVHTGSVLYDSTQYHLWYSAWDGLSNWVRTGHATSPDGLTWTKDPSNPVLTVGSWDTPRAELASVVFDGDTFHMWYAGGDYFLYKIGYATSTDGSKWTKSPYNPVINTGGSGTWDSKMVAPFSVIDSSGVKYKMWYWGSKTDGTASIGYAESPAHIHVPLQPGSISGNGSTCTGVTETYSVINVPEVTYLWKVTGGTVSGIDTSNSVNILWNSAGGQTITVTPSNRYGSGKSSLLTVSVKSLPQQPSKITGNMAVCTSEITKNYKVSFVSGVKYSWTLTGGTISGNDSTNSVYIAWDSAGIQTVNVIPRNSCGAGPERQLEVTVNSKLSPDTITGELNPHINDTCNYAILQVSGASYIWDVSGGNIINDFGDTVSVVWTSSGNQTISVSVRNSCGTGDPYILNVDVITDVFNLQSGNMISVYPNPAADIINIEINNTYEQYIVIELLTVSGQVIYRKEYKNLNDPFVKQIDLSGYSKGVYFLRIMQAGAVYNGKIIVI
jgi:hypothetical protein